MSDQASSDSLGAAPCWSTAESKGARGRYLGRSGRRRARLSQSRYRCKSITRAGEWRVPGAFEFPSPAIARSPPLFIYSCAVTHVLPDTSDDVATHSFSRLPSAAHLAAPCSLLPTRRGQRRSHYGTSFPLAADSPRMSRLPRYAGHSNRYKPLLCRRTNTFEKPWAADCRAPPEGHCADPVFFLQDNHDYSRQTKPTIRW